ncbi:MAG: hypothetical protein WC859_03270 [Elusimicrobiota bacterium]
MNSIPFLPTKFLFSPRKVLERFDDLRRKHGDNAVFSQAPFKPAREARAVAIFAIGLGKDSQREFWIGSPEKDPPDAWMVELIRRPKGSSRSNFPIEVMEWESNSPFNDITEAIDNKLKRKNYLKNTILVVDVEKPNSPIRSMNVVNHFKSNRPNIAEIWLLCANASGLWPSDMNVRVFPQQKAIHFDVHLEFRRLAAQRGVIDLRRGTKKGVDLPRMEEIELP